MGRLRNAASGVVASALDALEARVLRGEASAPRAQRGRQLERMREVLERDRALVESALPAPAPVQTPAAVQAPAQTPPSLPSPAASAALSSASASVCDEPIRTRSMAKLLAAQGHPERALAIYGYLLARDGNDPVLQAEAAALRESLVL